MLINTAVLPCVRIGAEWSVRELLAAVSDGISRRSGQHQRTPLGTVLAWAGLPGRDTTLIDSLFVFDRQRLHDRHCHGGDARRRPRPGWTGCLRTRWTRCAPSTSRRSTSS